MRKLARNIGVAFSIAAALAGCAKSPEQIAQEQAEAVAREDMVTALVEQSAAKCETAPTEYLQKHLMKLDSGKLAAFRDNGVTICLDARLATQTPEGRMLLGIFYNNPAQKVLSLHFNGESGNYTYAMLTRAPRIMQRNDGKDYYAGRFGTLKTRSTRWESEAQFASRLAANPQLQTPPLKTAP